MKTFLLRASICTFLLMNLTSPSTSATPIKLFPDKAPGETKALEEKVEVAVTEADGQTDRYISNVSTPTLEIFPASPQPEDKDTQGAEPQKNTKKNPPTKAVLVCPGGGYNILSFDKEGTEVCKWFQEKGITAALLKYRVPRREGLPKHLAALQDAQRALRYLRFNAEKLNINPDMIGVIGFSAGGHLAVMSSVMGDEETYPPIDETDKVSARPNFAVLVYPAYLAGKDPLALDNEILVDKKTPPTYILQTAEDDSFIMDSLAYYHALQKAKIPVEMHLYPKGQHGFGWRIRAESLKNWKDTLASWLKHLPSEK